MSDLVGNPEDRFSRVAAHFAYVPSCHHEIAAPLLQYESGWTTKLGHDFPEFITTNCIKSFGEVDERHVNSVLGISPEALLL